MKAHPAAALFPTLPEDELSALAADIKAHGQIEAIVTHEGAILDGRNRYAACELAGVSPRLREWAGEHGSPTRYAITVNVQRRHLTPSQKAMLAVEALPLLEAEAAERKRQKAAEAGKKAQAVQQRGEDGRMKPADRGVPKIGDTPVASEPEAKPAAAPEEKKRDKHAAADDAAALFGVSRGYVEEAKAIALASPESKARVIENKVTIPQARKEIRREEVKAKLEEVTARESVAPPSDRRYGVLVMDPPWPIEKIERDCRPNQVELDYPTMSLGEIQALDVPGRLQDDAHVWLWTTHRFLPDSFALLKAWGLRYVCTFVWHKPGGFQPVGLPQFNCEFALYARKGSPSFVDTKALPVCASWPRGKHSEKPEEFYELLRRVTGGIRLDWFNRRAIDGFDVCGKEAHRE